MVSKLVDAKSSVPSRTIVALVCRLEPPFSPAAGANSSS
ncbi:hypothetical protein D043_4081A, partial [Vibrio parahaemolyticus EKP-021]